MVFSLLRLLCCPRCRTDVRVKLQNGGRILLAVGYKLFCSEENREEEGEIIP